MRKQITAMVLGILLLTQTAVAFADSSSSTNYKVENAQFSSGSSTSCSTNYCSESSAGSDLSGSASSKNYQIQFQPDPSKLPLMEVEAIGGQQNLGYLDPSHVSTASDIVKVLNYSGSGYAVQITGSPPGQGTHTLDPLSSPSSSHPGAEQFGINLVANNDPTVGSNPVQVTSDKSDYGFPEDNYSTPDLFSYKDGDYVASSKGSYSETDYTISMIINISNTTPIGHYSGSFNTVVVPTY